MCIQCTRRQWLAGTGVLLLAGLAGCDGKDSVADTVNIAAAPLTSEAECALCGMRIAGFPGPKAQAIVTVGQQRRTLFFCSTRDFLAFFLQPENRSSQTTLYVQDMTSVDWDRPEPAPWISARE